MYKIIFYRDRKGEEPVIEYMDALEAENTKDARISAGRQGIAFNNGLLQAP